jgi:Ca-activated chloride channel family protein
MAGAMPPREAVRIEKMVNCFPDDYPAPEGDAPFRPTVTVMPSASTSGAELVRLAMPERAARPPLNLVFPIDTRGSMQDPDKLPLLKQSLRLMLGELGPEDEVAIMTNAGAAELRQAYDLAEAKASDGEIGRVILATDGDVDVGLSDPDALERFVATERAGGTCLSVLGFGRGDLDDAMQARAQAGNGQAAYIDTLAEARKVLVDQLTGALFPIADDVKVQVEWNPATVADYRLIAYETRALRREDFNDGRADTGEIGAGAYRDGDLRDRAGGVRGGDDGCAALRTAVGRDGVRGARFPVALPQGAGRRRERPDRDADPSREGDGVRHVRFGVAVAGFGQLLRGSELPGGWGWSNAIARSAGARGEDPFGYRAEAVTPMRLAQRRRKRGDRTGRAPVRARPPSVS